MKNQTLAHRHSNVVKLRIKVIDFKGAVSLDQMLKEVWRPSRKVIDGR